MRWRESDAAPVKPLPTSASSAAGAGGKPLANEFF